jgi:hypothetical protein
MPNNKYNLVAENPQSTVVGEYVADGVRVAHYQKGLKFPVECLLTKKHPTGKCSYICEYY